MSTTMFTLVLFLSVAAAVKGLFCAHDCTCDTSDNSAKCRDLTSVPRFPPQLVIQSLDMSGSLLSTLEDMAFQSSPHVQMLNLSRCSITSVSVLTFYSLTSLKEVDLSYNKLSSVSPLVFFNNHALRTVSLKYNPLVHLSPGSPILISDSISSFNLNHCKIRRLYPATFSRLPKLRTLDLSSNKLEVLVPQTLTAHAPDLVSVQLRNNMWRCGEEFTELLCWTRYKEMSCISKNGSREMRTRRDCGEEVAMSEKEIKALKANALIVMWAVATVWIVAIAALAVIKVARMTCRKKPPPVQQPEEIQLTTKK